MVKSSKYDFSFIFSFLLSYYFMYSYTASSSRLFTLTRVFHSQKGKYRLIRVSSSLFTVQGPSVPRGTPDTVQGGPTPWTSMLIVLWQNFKMYLPTRPRVDLSADATSVLLRARCTDPVGIQGFGLQGPWLLSPAWTGQPFQSKAWPWAVFSVAILSTKLYWQRFSPALGS